MNATLKIYFEFVMTNNEISRIVVIFYKICYYCKIKYIYECYTAANYD